MHGRPARSVASACMSRLLVRPARPRHRRLGLPRPGRRRRGCASSGAEVVAPRQADYDLTEPGAADAAGGRPPARDLVIHLAARVGGIGYNQAEPAPLYLANLLMGTYVIEAARRHAVDKTVLVGTVCSYPKFTPVPFPRTRCGTATPRRRTRRTASPRRRTSSTPRSTPPQYGQRFAYLIPTNLYGPGDKFHPQRLPRHPRADQEVRRGGGAGRRQGRGVGHRPGQPRVPLRRRRRRGHRARGRARTRAPSRSTSAPTTRSPSARRSSASPRSSASTASCVWDPTKPDGQPRRRVDAVPGRARCSAGGRRCPSTRGCGAPSTGTSPTATKPSARPEVDGASALAPPDPSSRDSSTTMPASTAGRRYAAARVSIVSCALSPLGLGTTHSAAPASGSGWRPGAASRRLNAWRYAVTPATATTTGRCVGDERSRRSPPAREFVGAELGGPRGGPRPRGW